MKKMIPSVNVTVVGRDSVLHFENTTVSLIPWASCGFDDSAVFTWPLLLTAAVQL